MRLLSGTLGVQIGSSLVGDESGDNLGGGGITALGNGNFVVRSPNDNRGGVFRAGSARLVNGVSGVQQGATRSGATSDDQEMTAAAAQRRGGFVVLGFAMLPDGSLDSGRVRLIAE